MQVTLVMSNSSFLIYAQSGVFLALLPPPQSPSHSFVSVTPREVGSGLPSALHLEA